jgi:hypothetical protein
MDERFFNEKFDKVHESIGKISQDLLRQKIEERERTDEIMTTHEKEMHKPEHNPVVVMQKAVKDHEEKRHNIYKLVALIGGIVGIIAAIYGFLNGGV